MESQVQFLTKVGLVFLSSSLLAEAQTPYRPINVNRTNQLFSPADTNVIRSNLFAGTNMFFDIDQFGRITVSSGPYTMPNTAPTNAFNAEQFNTNMSGGLLHIGIKPGSLQTNNDFIINNGESISWNTNLVTITETKVGIRTNAPASDFHVRGTTILQNLGNIISFTAPSISFNDEFTITYEGSQFLSFDGNVNIRLTLSATNIVNGGTFEQRGKGTNFAPMIQNHLTADRLVVLNDKKEPTNSITTLIEASYLTGSYSNIQTQLNQRWPHPNYRRHALFMHAATGLNAFGDAFQATAGTITYVTQPSSVLRPYAQFATVATTGSDGGLQGAQIFRTGNNNLLYYVLMALPQTNAIRCWWGLTDQTQATMFASDNPAGNYAMIRISTDATDVNVKAITKDNVTQSITDTGFAVITNETEYAIVEDLTNSRYVFYINESPVATNTANLPTANSNIRMICGCETRENVSKTPRLTYMAGFSDL